MVEQVKKVELVINYIRIFSIHGYFNDDYKLLEVQRSNSQCKWFSPVKKNQF